MADNRSAKSELHKSHHSEPKQSKVEYLPAFLLVAAFFFLPNGPESGSLNTFAIFFVRIILEAIPFMLVGSLAGGFIEAFVSQERMAIILPQKRWLTVCVAAGAGILFPVCECAVVPVVRRLVGKGLPLAAAIAYLLGGPIVNPIVGASTALAYVFDWRIVILRLSLGYGIAVVIGMLMGKLFTNAEAIKDNGAARSKDALSWGCYHGPLEHTSTGGDSGKPQHLPIISQKANVSTTCGCGCPPILADSWIDKTGTAFTHAMDDFLAVSHYLVIGAFTAALAQTYVDRSSFLSLSSTPILSVVLMMALAILLNLCSEADAFIAASFRGLMPAHAQMAFMLTGPMFDLKLLLMYQSVFRRRAIVVLSSLILAAVLVVAVGLGVLTGMIL